jgi:ribonuclease VapC
MNAIVVDTSALVAIALKEAPAGDCMDALAACELALLSAGTVAECLVVGARRGISQDLVILLDRFNFDIIPVTAESARAVGDAYARWGKGVHPAKLNFGDCFAYALAIERGCPLLFVGEDFARTDVRSAIA